MYKVQNFKWKISYSDVDIYKNELKMVALRNSQDFITKLKSTLFYTWALMIEQCSLAGNSLKYDIHWPVE